MQRNSTRQNGNQDQRPSLSGNPYDPDREGRNQRDTGYKPGGYDRGLDRDHDKLDQGSNRIDGSRGSDKRMEAGAVDPDGEQFYRDMGNHGLDTSSPTRDFKGNRR